MLQSQLLIANSKNSEDVRFNVNLPEGYDSFQINGIQGSIINQNYFKVNDTLNIKLNNNIHINYKQPLSLEIANSSNDSIVEDGSYSSVCLDIFKLYKAVYIPIFQHYEADEGFMYLFNPCDENGFLDEPTHTVEPALIWDRATKIYMPFTGQFVIGLKKVDDDEINIPITIGESIENTKNTSTDEGSYIIQSNGQILETSSNESTYSYASNWKFNINNLIMKHRLTREYQTVQAADFVSELTIFQDIDSNIFTVSSAFGERYFTNKVSNNLIIQDEGLPHNDLVLNVSNINMLEYIPIYNGQLDRVPTIEDIPGDKSAIKGSDLSVGDAYYSAEDFSTPITSLLTIKSNVYYSLKVWNIQAVNQDGSIYIGKFKAGGEVVSINFSTSSYSELLNENNQPVYLKFKLSNGAGEFIHLDYLATGDIHISGNGLYEQTNEQPSISLAIGIYTGKIKNITQADGSFITNPDVSERLQHWDSISNSQAYIPIDELSCHVEASEPITLHVEAQDLTNQIIVQLDNGNLRVDRAKWGIVSGSYLKPAAFIPLKTTRWLQPFNKPNYKTGFFKIKDINGNLTTDLLDSNSEVFLAIGHETVNVQPPNQDDFVYKTFNGSLMFDRSNTKITRIFSNSTAESILGYINDILSAKLLRYYFVCDYTTFDAFLNTNKDIILATNQRTLFAYYLNNDLMVPYGHDIVISSLHDAIKFIGGENVMNNIFPSLMVEEQNQDGKFQDFNSLGTSNNVINTIHMKLFHYYPSGTTSFPYFGFSTSDLLDGSGSIGGFSVGKLPETALLRTPTNPGHTITETISHLFSVKDDDLVSTDKLDILRTTQLYESNKWKSVSSVQPVARVYRNNNFEQSDLTITTGGVRLLHPIYVQSVNPALLNNVLFMFDTLFGLISNQWGSLASFNPYGMFNFLRVRNNSHTPLTHIGNEHLIIKRFSKRLYYPHVSKNNRELRRYAATSFDSLLLLNYLKTENLNTFEDVDDQRFNAKHCEIIKSVESNHINLNVQLLSTKTFNYNKMLEERAEMGYVCAQSTYSDAQIDSNVLSFYMNDEQAENYLNNLVYLTRGLSSFNNLKSIKIFIFKLGEVLVMPTMIYGVSLNFQNAPNASIYFMNMENYQPVIQGKLGEPQHVQPVEEKQNTHLFGIVFKYNQTALGYSRYENDLNGLNINISKSKGLKTFSVVLCDEYGRTFPNTDTNQGFANNLKLEILLNTAPMEK